MDNTSGGASVAGETKVTEGDEGRGRGCGCWIALIVVLVVGGLVTAYLGGSVALQKKTTFPGEAEIADFANRTLAVPSNYQDMRIPAKFTDSSGHPTADTINKGKSLFGANCSFCHGGGGKGDAPLGASQYPPAANLTLTRTQNKADGQLYWFIAHGINFTGMPGWRKDFPGGSLTDDDIWALVAYVRTLK